MSVHVASVGVGRFGKRAEGLVDLAAEAAGLALEGVGRKPIDLLVVGTMLGHGLQGREPFLPRLAARLSLEGASGLRAESTSATGAMAFHLAADALAAGRFDRALVVAAEKMTDRTTPEVTGELAAALHPSEAAHGATMPALAALVTQRYLDRHDLPAAAIDRPSVHARAMATRNPNAMFSTPVTLEEVAGSRPVASPLRLLHCPLCHCVYPPQSLVALTMVVRANVEDIVIFTFVPAEMFSLAADSAGGNFRSPLSGQHREEPTPGHYGVGFQEFFWCLAAHF